MSKLRSKMFFGDDSYIDNGKEIIYQDAGTKLDKFLQEHSHIKIKKVVMQFVNNDDHPSSHAVLIIYEEL